MLEGPTPIGAVGPTTNVLPDVIVLVVLTKIVDVEETELFAATIVLETELEVEGALIVLFWKIWEELVLEVEDPVVKITDDEEMVLFAVTIVEVVEGAEDTSVELTEDSVELTEDTVEVVEDTVEVVEIPLDVVNGATLLLLELVGASLILRAPLIPLLELGFPSFFFM
jgi:hypothetical protein